MDYKILIIKNPLGTIKINDDFDKVKTYFKDRTPLNIVVDYLDVNIENLQHSIFLNKLGHDWYGLTNIKDRIRALNIVPENKYHTCIFIYDGATTQAVKEGKYVTGWSTYGEMVPGTEFIEVVTNTQWDAIGDIYRVATHEIIHSFIKRAGRQGRIVTDVLDQTIINGKIEYYYKEFQVESSNGNRQLTLNNLSDYWNIVCKQKMIYKYFSEKEIVGLKPELVELLDKARGIAGIPFVINSGYRTLANNEDVGGVKDSSHIKGLAVDLRARNSTEHFLITKALIQVGFTRISRSYPNHIHCDIDPYKPKNVLF